MTDFLLCSTCNKHPTRLPHLPCGKCRRTSPKSCPLLQTGSEPTTAAAANNDDSGSSANNRWSGALMFASALFSGFILWRLKVTPSSLTMADSHYSSNASRTILEFGAMVVVSCALVRYLVVFRAFCFHHRGWNNIDDEAEEVDDILSTIKNEEECLSCESCLLDCKNGRHYSGLRTGMEGFHSNLPSFIFCQDIHDDNDDTMSPHQQKEMLSSSRPIPIKKQPNADNVEAAQLQSKKKYDLSTWKMYHRIIGARSRARAETCGLCMESIIGSGELVTLTMGKKICTQTRESEEERLLAATCPSALYYLSDAASAADSNCHDGFLVREDHQEEETRELKVHRSCYYGATGGLACVHRNVQLAEEGMVFQLDM
ncbi:hypothetical protein ACHAXN_013461 [Cyclotella atomus]